MPAISAVLSLVDDRKGHRAMRGRNRQRDKWQIER